MSNDCTQTPDTRVVFGERGAAAVEFAFILPLLLALVGGIIDFGFGFYSQVGLAHAAREGVRAEAIGTADGATTAEAAFVPIAVTNVAGTVVQNCPSPDKRARVRIQADYGFFILPFADKTFSSEAVMRCGG